MTAAHTPGPWEYYPATNYSGFAIAPLGRLPTLAAIDDVRKAVTAFNFPAETEANARLIASAPDMLAALTDCLAALTDPVVGTIYGDDPNWYQKVDEAADKALAAIAKATGQ